CPPAGGATVAATSSAATAGTTSAASATAAATAAATTAARNPGYLGVRVEAVDTCGVRILEVLPGSPASTSGLQTGDVIVAIDGTAVTGVSQARSAIESKEAGTKVTLTVQRAGQEMTITATL